MIHESGFFFGLLDTCVSFLFHATVPKPLSGLTSDARPNSSRRVWYLGVGSLSTTAATGGATSPALATEAPTGVALTTRSAAIEATTATLTTARAVVGATVGRGLGSALLNNDVLAIDDVRVGGESSVVAFNSLILDKGAVLLAVDIKVRKLTMSLESALKITFLDFIRYKLDVTESVFLVNGCG